MKKKLKNLLIDLGPGYHHQARILHNIVKDKCDSSVLFFDINKEVDRIGDDLRLHSLLEYKNFPKTFDLFRDFLKKNNILCNYQLFYYYS